MSFSLSHPLSTHELETRNGPILIGFTLNCLLYGLLLAQICIYIRGLKRHNDGVIMQGLAYSLCFVESFRLAIVIQSVWGLLIELNARPGFVAGSTPLAFILPALAGFESAAVQAFFAWRVWSMRRQDWPYWIVAAIITLIAVMQTVGSVGLSSQLRAGTTQPDHTYPNHAIHTLIVIWLGGSFICDLFVVIAMAVILIKVRQEATFRETERLVNYLLRLTAETGALTVLAASVMLGLYLRFPGENYYLGILFILGGLYTNILLYMLNSRQESRGVRHTEISFNLATISRRPTGSLSSISQPQVDTELRQNTKV